MAKENFLDHRQPKYLLAEIPVKGGSWHDDRLWVIHTESASILEIIEISDVLVSDFTEVAGEFLYGVENYIAVWVKDNAIASGFTAEQVYEGAIDFITDYFTWEDAQVDELE